MNAHLRRDRSHFGNQFSLSSMFNYVFQRIMSGEDCNPAATPTPCKDTQGDDRWMSLVCVLSNNILCNISATINVLMYFLLCVSSAFCVFFVIISRNDQMKTFYSCSTIALCQTVREKSLMFCLLAIPSSSFCMSLRYSESASFDRPSSKVGTHIFRI